MLEDLFWLGGIGFVLWALYQSNPATAGDAAADPGGTIMDAINQQIVTRLAQAIAVAEGFYVPGSRPARDHNPGDMTEDLIGRAIGRDKQFVVYATDQDGFDNLYAQIVLWLSGKSAHANENSTIQQIADFYTTTQQDIWARNVADHLGVSVDTQIGQLG